MAREGDTGAIDVAVCNRALVAIYSSAKTPRKLTGRYWGEHEFSMPVSAGTIRNPPPTAAHGSIECLRPFVALSPRTSCRRLVITRCRLPLLADRFACAPCLGKNDRHACERMRAISDCRIGHQDCGAAHNCPPSRKQTSFHIYWPWCLSVAGTHTNPPSGNAGEIIRLCNFMLLASHDWTRYDPQRCASGEVTGDFLKLLSVSSFPHLLLP
jgi:hypothetical protein